MKKNSNSGHLGIKAWVFYNKDDPIPMPDSVDPAYDLQDLINMKV